MKASKGGVAPQINNVKFISNLRPKRAGKINGAVVRRIVAFCAMHILGKLPRKKIPPILYFLFSHDFSRRNFPLPVNGVDAPGSYRSDTVRPLR